MSSRTHGDQGTPTAPPAGVPAGSPPEAGAGPVRRGRRHRPRWVVVVLAVALVLALGAGAYLFTLARAWQERAEELDAVAHDLGADLAVTRTELEETQSSLTIVETQLDGAREQIRELADTVAQTGDDREVQRQVAEYQAELFAAAAGVTGTMAECITDQQAYVVALEEEVGRLRAELAQADDEDASPTPEATDEADLPALRETLGSSCQEAADAHEDLRERLSDS